MLLLLLTCGADTQDALDKLVPRGAVRAKTALAPQHRRPQGLFGHVVGRLDTVFAHECPERILMRQQFLANEMELAHELGADVVSVLHIAPAHNLDFRRVTSPKLQPLAKSVIEVWQRLVRESDRFASVHTETLFGPFPADRFPELGAWRDYISARYSWVC